MTTDTEAKPRRRTPRVALPDTTDAVEIAMAAVASGKPLPDAARTVLEKHARLIDRQADLAKAQTAELHLRNVGERVRAVLWAMLALAAAAVVALIIAVVLRAMRSDALIVEAFDVPPALEAKGLTGKVVATQVLDRLAELQAKSYSTRPAASYATDWGDELKIDIPNTGTSFDQVWKLLRGWLGQETRISGEVFETSQGLALTARTGGDPGQRFVSSTGDLDTLVTNAAELIYKNTQPYRYAVYLQADRINEAETVLRQLTRDPSPTERKWAYNGLSVVMRNMGRLETSLAMARRALAIDPQMLPAANNIGIGYFALGRDQEMVDAFAKARTLPSDGYEPVIVEANRCMNDFRVGTRTRDPVRLDSAAECLAATPSSFVESAPFPRFFAATYRHDANGARNAAQAMSVPSDRAYALLMLALADKPASEVSQALAAARQARQAQVDAASPAERARLLVSARTYELPIEAEALARLGRVADAQALIDRTPMRCYYCVRVRGFIAEAARRPDDAARWYAEAVRQGPRLAPAYLDLGLMLAKQRRDADAAAKIELATTLAPNWADPLKAKGDMLASQGKRADARKAYDNAIKLAPHWEAPRQARAKA